MPFTCHHDMQHCPASLRLRLEYHTRLVLSNIEKPGTTSASTCGCHSLIVPPRTAFRIAYPARASQPGSPNSHILTFQYDPGARVHLIGIFHANPASLHMSRNEKPGLLDRLSLTTGQATTLDDAGSHISQGAPAIRPGRWRFNYLLSRRAARQLETGNARLPAGCAGLLASQRIVLIDVPERAVVNRIDIQRGVVAPTGVRRPLHA